MALILFFNNNNNIKKKNKKFTNIIIIEFKAEIIVPNEMNEMRTSHLRPQ